MSSHPSIIISKIITSSSGSWPTPMTRPSRGEASWSSTCCASSVIHHTDMLLLNWNWISIFVHSDLELAFSNMVFMTDAITRLNAWLFLLLDCLNIPPFHMMLTSAIIFWTKQKIQPKAKFFVYIQLWKCSGDKEFISALITWKCGFHDHCHHLFKMLEYFFYWPN